MPESTLSQPQTLPGGAFLTTATAQTFTPEDLTPEHLAIARTAAEFWKNEIEPNIAALRSHQPGLGRSLLRKAADLGLTAVTVPEEFGGMELDLASDIVIAEQLGLDGSFATWHGAHTGIGTLPLLYFGTDEQKRRYLPRLSSLDLLAAYALSEPQAGSDALAINTRADLAPDGTHYVLKGQKMWITNGADADLFTVFAKIGGDRFTALIVERGFGVQSGAEEKKMGIEGSSTTALYFDNVRVPVENVLGEIGRGHLIAFNILNIGRLKLGAMALGGAKRALALSIEYAKQRRAFSQPIASFGAIRHKLAEMAIRIYAAESLVWRTVGLIQQTAVNTGMLRALEEHAIECSIAKVFCSEVLDYVVDEAVQIHGGYGYHRDYAVENAYRDARINRIFEGTNEINRLLIPDMLMKRVARGSLTLQPPSARDDSSAAKRIALLTLQTAHQRFGPALASEQEVLMNIADIVIDIFALESAELRRSRLPATSTAKAMCSVLRHDRWRSISAAAEDALAACLEGDKLDAAMSQLRQLCPRNLVNTVELRRSIAQELLTRGRYVV
ncbi:MAG: acyl-CoA dehydrogenase family protein [Acidobacteriaceae bacterium]|nr:acyl-CoA dehydrogenase family protein [Acidobacteriaceae bacterium]